MAHRSGTWIWILLPLLAGCPSADSPTDGRGAGQLPPAGTELVLCVVDDPAMGAAIERLRGEWEAQTGWTLRVDSMTGAALSAADGVPGDAAICPASQMGELAHRGQAVPVGEPLPQGWADVFSLLRAHGCVWAGEVVGVPLGTPLLTVYYRADLLEEVGRQPPTTWAEYDELARLLGDRSALGEAAPPGDRPWHGAIEPLGPGWAGLVLLARAAPYAIHRENYSTLFHVDTMEPLVAGPPFVRALEELIAIAGAADRLADDPDSVRAAFWRGECGLALTWPTAAKEVAPAGGGLAVGFAELPGSPEAYDVGDRAWEPRRSDEDPRVPLLGVAGRMGVVSRRSTWPQAARRLLWWLSDEQSSAVCPASPATTLFRTTQVKSPQGWVEAPVPATAAAEYAEATRAALSRQQRLFALRLPGRAEYLAALDDAVHRAVRGEQTPAESLREAVATWQSVTERLGVDSQRQAYWDSIGLQ
jgi:multiple sugar transport system substrate-binding protein